MIRSVFRSSIAVSTAAMITLAPAYANMGIGSMIPAASTAGLGSLLSNIAGTTSVANGTQNVNTGQQTQNQAQMAMGAMQIAQGLLGLAAAAAAAAQQGKGNQNASKMGTSGYDPYNGTSGSGTSPTPGNTNSTTGSSDTGNTASNTNTVQLTPESIRSGELGAALSSIEKAYGIPRDDFVRALQNGVDPKALLANAPKNAPSMDLLGKIEAGLASANAAKSAEALAAAGLNGSGASNLASLGGNGTGGAPTGSETASGGPRMPASTAPPEDSLDDINAASNMNLSPEIKAAMAAKAAQLRAEKEMKEMHGWSIFQLVHNRYKKLEPMLYGRVERTNVKPVPNEI